MVAKIRLEAENTTGAAFDSLKNSTQSVDHTAETLGDTLGELQRRFDEAKAALNRLSQGQGNSVTVTNTLSDAFREGRNATQGTEQSIGSLKQLTADFNNTLASLRDELHSLSNAERTVATGADHISERMGGARASVGRAGSAMGQMGSSTGQVVAAMANLEAAQLESEVQTESFNETLKAFGANARTATNGLDGTTRTTTDFTAVLLKVWALKETFVKLAHGIKYLADQGNPAANSLTRAVDDLTQQFVKLGETSAFQRMIEGVTGAVDIATEALGEMSKETNTWAGNFGWAMRQAQDTLGIIITASAEAAGLIASGSTDDARRAARERENAIKNHDQLMDQEHKRMDVAKQLAEVEKIRAEFRKVSQQEEAQQWAETFHSIDDVVAAQKEELEQLNKMAASAEASASEQEEAKRRLTELEKRRQDLTREGIEKERRQTEEAIADRRAAREAEIEEAVADHEKLVKSLEQREAAHQERIKKIQEAAQLTGKDGVAKGLQALGSKVTRDKAVRKYVADREELAASWVSDSSKGMNPLELRKMIDRARRQARQEAKRDIQSGAANADLTQIQGEMATKVIDQAEASGKLGKNTADALREAAKSAAKNRAEMESINEEVKQIREWFGEFNKGSSRDRQRAQRRQ